MDTQQLKAQFCKHHFIAMLTFVNHCDISSNDFGLAFLNETLPKDSQHDYVWHLEGDDRIAEKDLMLGIEEFWLLTEEKYATQRDELVECLLRFGRGHHNNIHELASLLLTEILVYFGGIQKQELTTIGNSTQQFGVCLGMLNHPNVNMINKKDGNFHNYLAFIFYTLIGLTSILRKEWNKNTFSLSDRYEKPPTFQMPEQEIRVHIGWDISQSLMTREDNGTNKDLSFSMLVRKYCPFKVDVTFGQPDYLKRRVEVEQMLTYYYWHTILDILVPTKPEKSPLVIKMKDFDEKI